MSTTPPEPHDHAGCDSCHYRDPVGGLTETTDGLEPPRRLFRLCAICYRTFTGNSLIYPGLYPDERVLRTIAWIGNRLREDIARGPAGLAPPPPGA